MASRFVRAAASGLMVATASAVAAGCARPDESGEVPPAATTVARPLPAVISFVTPAIAQVPAAVPPSPAVPPLSAAPPLSAVPQSPAAPTAAPPPVMPVPIPEHAPAAVPPDLGIMSAKIEHVMVDLDQLVEASLQLQYRLLRLRLRPKRPPPPESDLAELPVGL